MEVRKQKECVDVAWSNPKQHYNAESAGKIRIELPPTAIAEMRVHSSEWKCDYPNVKARDVIWSTLVGNPQE